MMWLFTDASPTGPGAWVGQGPTRDAARPGAFHSRKLTLSQNAYPTHRQEALAIVEAIASFEYLLRNRRFTVVTDHESLTKMMIQKSLSGRQQRWLTFFSQLDFEIEYQPGTENFLADYLSRIDEWKPNSTDITLRDPTSQGSKTDGLSDTQALSIDTHYASSLDYPTDSEDAMYYASEEKPSPTLTSYNSILRSSLEYFINEGASYAITAPRHPKTPLINARIYHKAPQASHLPLAPIATGKARLYLLLPANKKRVTQRQAGRAALTITLNYIAKKKQRPVTGLRILGSESRTKRPKESEQPSKYLSPVKKNSPTIPPICHTSLKELHLLEWKNLFSIPLV